MNKLIPFKTRDLAEAAPDFLAGLFGEPLSGAHPIAEHLLENDFTGPDLIMAFGQARLPGEQHTGKLFAAGLATSDFTSALADSVSRIVNRAYDSADLGHRKITTDFPMPDFRVGTIPVVDLGDEVGPLEQGAEGVHFPIGLAEGLPARVRTIGRRLNFSRHLFLANNPLMISASTTQITAGIVRAEQRAVFEYLQSDPTMPDTDPLFVGGVNALTGGLDLPALGAAMARLRLQPTEGETLANNQAARLIVPAAYEAAALALVETLGASRLQVIAAPWLAAGQWYLQADTAAAPTLGFLYLDGTRGGRYAGGIGGRTTQVQAKRPPIRRDGVDVVCWSDFGITAISRIGIVRITAA